MKIDPNADLVAKRPLLTIATINKNNAFGLRKTIESVLSQKDSRVEYVVLDGYSDDDSVQVAQSYADGLDFFESKRDSGISDAFNRSVSVARGTWILLLNSGDCLSDAVLPRICNALESSGSELICFSTRIINGPEAGKILTPLYRRLGMEMSIAHPSTFVKSTVYQKYGVYDLSFKYAMDYEFFLRSRNLLEFEEIPFVIALMDGVGVSSQSVWRRNVECWKARKKNDFNPVLNFGFTLRRLLREWISSKGFV